MTNRKIALFVFFVSSVALLSGFSCHHKSMQTSLGVSASLAALQNETDSLYKSGKIDYDENQLLEKQFKVLAQTSKDVRQCIYVSNTGSCVDVGINAINNMLAAHAVVGIKNPDSRNQIKALAEAVILSLNGLKAAL
jgi:hypothetical protein